MKNLATTTRFAKFHMEFHRERHETLTTFLDAGSAILHMSEDIESAKFAAITCFFAGDLFAS